MIIASPGPCLLAMVQQTRSENVAQVSVIFVARAAGYLTGSVLGGISLDALPTRGNLVLALALLAAASCTVLVPLVSSLSVLSSLMVAIGLAMGVTDTAANVLMIALHGKGDVDPYMHAQVRKPNRILCPHDIAICACTSANLPIYTTATFQRPRVNVPNRLSFSPAPPLRTQHFFFGLGAFSSHLALLWAMGDTYHYSGAMWAFGAILATGGAVLLALPSPNTGGAAEGAAHASSEVETGGGGAVRCVGLALTRQEWFVVGATAMFLAQYVGIEVAFGGFIYT